LPLHCKLYYLSGYFVQAGAKASMTSQLCDLMLHIEFVFKTAA